jgi:hypothetical protein
VVIGTSAQLALFFASRSQPVLQDRFELRFVVAGVVFVMHHV